MRLRVLYPCCSVLLMAIGCGSSSAEIVEVAYHGEVDLDHLACTEIPAGSRVRRVCYDEANRYLLVRYEETWRHFCAVEAAIVDRLLAAPVIDRRYRSSIENQYPCRAETLPDYQDVPPTSEARAP
jgi:hypothetical protein